jgi:hypothetical protein
VTWAVPYLVFLHVLGVVFAFGPTFSYGFFGSLLANEPEHRDFFGRGRALVSKRLTVPATWSLLVTGVLIVLASGLPVLSQAMRWLQLGIVLYLAMLGYILFVLDPLNRRIGQLGASLRGGTLAPADVAAARAQIQQLVSRSSRDGKALGVVVIVIIFLMVVKPGFPI